MTGNTQCGHASMACEHTLIRTVQGKTEETG